MNGKATSDMFLRLEEYQKKRRQLFHEGNLVFNPDEEYTFEEYENIVARDNEEQDIDDSESDEEFLSSGKPREAIVEGR